MPEPAYLRLPSGELRRRAEEAVAGGVERVPPFQRGGLPAWPERLEDDLLRPLQPALQVLPELRHLAGDSRAILEWIATRLGRNTYVNLMDQYYPAGKVTSDYLPEINRRLGLAELDEARKMASDLGLQRLDERKPHPLLRRPG